jgi:serine/threonine-protein kinase
MGIVYRAEDVLLQRPAAIKVIDPSLASSPESVELFLREARTLARLRHEHVVQIYAFGRSGRSHYFAMELVDGENLDDRLLAHADAGTSMPLARVLDVVQKVASGLTAAHARAVMHRDVKPANIVIERATGRPVLLDFGIARSAKDTHLERSSGTPTYMAPEQIRNEMGLDGARADLYSLACTAFEMLAGAPPFPGASAYELMTAHLEAPPPLLSTLRPEHAALDQVFVRALAKDPAERHASCVAFAEDLARAASGPRALVFAADGLRRTLVRELRHAGFDDGAIDCVDGASALLRLVAARRPAIAILDDDAAGGASFELAGALRRSEHGRALQLLVLTRELVVDRSVWRAVGARHLSKPLSARALAAVLEELSARGSSAARRRT